MPLITSNIEGTYADVHCKFFHGKFYRFFLCNFSHYSLTMIFTEKDFETNHLKIYENYLLIP